MAVYQRCRTSFVAAGIALSMALCLGSVTARAADSALPAAAQQGSVTFLSGGVGLDESKAIKQAASHWPLSLSFIGGQRDFVSDVEVSITDASGQKVLQTTSQGPYMLVRLKPGKYTVEATYTQQQQKKSVSISSNGHAQLSFNWKHL